MVFAPSDCDDIAQARWNIDLAAGVFSPGCHAAIGLHRQSETLARRHRQRQGPSDGSGVLESLGTVIREGIAAVEGKVDQSNDLIRTVIRPGSVGDNRPAIIDPIRREIGQKLAEGSRSRIRPEILRGRHSAVFPRGAPLEPARRCSRLQKRRRPERRSLRDIRDDGQCLHLAGPRGQTDRGRNPSHFIDKSTREKIGGGTGDRRACAFVEMVAGHQTRFIAQQRDIHVRQDFRSTASAIPKAQFIHLTAKRQRTVRAQAKTQSTGERANGIGQTARHRHRLIDAIEIDFSERVRRIVNASQMNPLPGRKGIIGRVDIHARRGNEPHRVRTTAAQMNFQLLNSLGSQKIHCCAAASPLKPHFHRHG